ncbi:MAG: hypothetical protein ABFD49_11180 [Armatimonadota bacterium]|nr:hypothetical protein [bacterium]
MSIFKDQIAADVSAVFLNPDEFGETHVIDGQSVTCVIDQDSDGQFAGDMSDGVYVVTQRVSVRECDLAKIPKQGKRIDIDDTPYICLSISREMGMLVITVTENSSA